MKDKLRELAERWAKRIGGEPSTTITSKEVCELLAILDAEGDGGAVAWMSPNKERLEFSRPDTVYGSHTIPLYTHPARSGVVSDEDVDAACVVYDNKTDMRADYPDIGAMRAALEHFARRTP